MAKQRRRRVSKKRGGRKRRRSVKTSFAKALSRLRSLPKHQCGDAIKLANDKFIRQMCSQVKKLRRAKVSSRMAKLMKRHKGKLRQLSNTRVSLSRKRKILSQKGGFLPLLLPILGSVASSVAGGLIGKAFG